MKVIPYHEALAKRKPRRRFYRFTEWTACRGAFVRVGITRDCKDIKVVCSRKTKKDEQTVLEFGLSQKGAAAMVNGLVAALGLASKEGKISL